jgi:hypothetical protein
MMSEKRRCSQTSWIDSRDERRQLRPWPDVRIDDAITERTTGAGRTLVDRLRSGRRRRRTPCGE